MWIDRRKKGVVVSSKRGTEGCQAGKAGEVTKINEEGGEKGGRNGGGGRKVFAT